MEQQRRRPAYASAQSDQRHCTSLFDNFLELNYIKSNLTHVCHLAVEALTCNSHVNYITIKHVQIISNMSNTKLCIIFFPRVDCLKSTQLNAANSQYALKQHTHTILQLHTLLYFK